MPPLRVVVVGAGIGGLSTAMRLSARGCEVTVCEKAQSPGGKMREIMVGKAAIDAGPTVFTMRWVFDELFAEVGRTFSDDVKLIPVTTLARHAWSERERLDLFADMSRSADAIGDFAGASQARAYRSFCASAKQTYAALQRTFLDAERPSMPALLGRLGIGGLSSFASSNPMSSLWSELGRHFSDPRLRQLFGRYATYVGSSPFEAPATLTLIAHVEQEGVWLVDGGMHRIARALAAAIEANGGTIRYGADVATIAHTAGVANGVVLASGERLSADAVVFNGDAGALADGLLGPLPAVLPDHGEGRRSLSAVTFAIETTARGFPLLRHSVFFSADYESEFAQLFAGGRMPTDPTVYICAQDRGDVAPTPDTADSGETSAETDRERLLCLINAPPLTARSGTRTTIDWSDTREIERCLGHMTRRLAACGLTLSGVTPASATTPMDFARLFPGSSGALYGKATHGWRASFQRPGARTRIRHLYLAGGTAHPGAGVPMAALSGRLAAEAVLKDQISPGRSVRGVTLGGTSTASATMGATRSR